MWARSVEIMLGLWLVVAPFVFEHFGQISPLTWSDMLSGTAVILIAAVSFFERLCRAHLLNLGVSLWLVLHGYFGYAHQAPPGAQNEILVGLTLILIAIIPPHSSEPPRSWRELLEQRVDPPRRGSEDRHLSL